MWRQRAHGAHDDGAGAPNKVLYACKCIQGIDSASPVVISQCGGSAHMERIMKAQMRLKTLSRFQHQVRHGLTSIADDFGCLTGFPEALARKAMRRRMLLMGACWQLEVTEKSTSSLWWVIF